MRKAAAVVMLSILAGCATIAPSPPREPTDAPAAVIDEDFNPNAIAKGKDHGYGNYWGIRQQKWNLISSVRKEGGTIVRGVIFSDNYDGDWRFWQYAATKDSKSLRVTVIKRDVGSCTRHSCSHFETVMVDLPDPMLIAAENDGLAIRLSSSRGDERFINITPEEAAEHNAAFAPLRSKYGK